MPGKLLKYWQHLLDQDQQMIALLWFSTFDLPGGGIGEGASEQ
jgi:hypothetical protein